jgi:hypothetical protein
VSSIVRVSSPPAHDASQKRWRPGTVEGVYSGRERGGEPKTPRACACQVDEVGPGGRQQMSGVENVRGATA